MGGGGGRGTTGSAAPGKAFVKEGGGCKNSHHHNSGATISTVAACTALGIYDWPRHRATQLCLWKKELALYEFVTVTHRFCCNGAGYILNGMQILPIKLQHNDP